MSTTNNGGPAFPISIPGVGDNGAGGMTLRDYFAAKAMQSLMESTEAPSVSREDFAEEAYRFADAMLAAREGKAGGKA